MIKKNSCINQTSKASKPVCRFSLHRNTETGMYTIRVKDMTKQQVQLLVSVLRNMRPVGVVSEYSCGLTVPVFEVRSTAPLVRSIGNLFAVPNTVFNGVMSAFDNHEFDTKDVLVDMFARPLNDIKPFGYEV